MIRVKAKCVYVGHVKRMCVRVHYTIADFFFHNELKQIIKIDYKTSVYIVVFLKKIRLLDFI
jgi:hypothetical protein